MLQLHHDLPTSGHPGVSQTYEKLLEHLWWPEMKKDTTYWCNSCEPRVQYKNGSHSKAPLDSLCAGKPFEIVTINFVEPMPFPTESGRSYLLMIKDYFTRYVEAVALPDKRANTVAQSITRKWIVHYGVMKVLHSDQPQKFESELMEEIRTFLHIEKTRYSPFHPEENSICWRLNGTLLSMLKPYMYDNVNDCDTLVPYILLAYRSTKHSSAGFTPAYLHSGRELRLPAQVVLSAPDKEP